MKCGYKTKDGIRYWLPQCMGGAISGSYEGCTCNNQLTNSQRIEGLEEQVANLVRKVRALDRKIIAADLASQESK